MGRLATHIVPITKWVQNCTIFFDEETRRGVIIDPGGEADRLLAEIKALGVEIEAIWLTHGHIDHSGGAADLSESLGVDIIGPHRADAHFLADLGVQAVRFGVDDVRVCESSRFLDDGDQVSFGDHVFEVFHCPGHSPGHVIYYNRAASLAHLGDVLLHGSIGQTATPEAREQLVRSIVEKVLPLGDDVDFISGHGPKGNIGEERRNNPALANL